MQTPAERELIDRLVSHGGAAAVAEPLSLLNIGAGSNVWIEEAVSRRGARFVCDRIDVELHDVGHPRVRRCLVGSVEAMTALADNAYDIAFANYVLEHVADLDAAAREIARVLKPGGVFMATVPDPRAPEFLLSRRTSLRFHHVVRGAESWETRYAYASPEDLVARFERAGFERVAVHPCSFLEGYLTRVRVLGLVGRAYDGLVNRVGPRRFRGNVFVCVRNEST